MEHTSNVYAFWLGVQDGSGFCSNIVTVKRGVLSEGIPMFALFMMFKTQVIPYGGTLERDVNALPLA